MLAKLRSDIKASVVLSERFLSSGIFQSCLDLDEQLSLKTIQQNRWTQKISRPQTSELRFVFFLEDKEWRTKYLVCNEALCWHLPTCFCFGDQMQERNLYVSPDSKENLSFFPRTCSSRCDIWAFCASHPAWYFISFCVIQAIRKRREENTTPILVFFGRQRSRLDSMSFCRSKASWDLFRPTNVVGSTAHMSRVSRSGRFHKANFQRVCVNVHGWEIWCFLCVSGMGARKLVKLEQQGHTRTSEAPGASCLAVVTKAAGRQIASETVREACR